MDLAAFEPHVFSVLGFFVVFKNERERERERERIPEVVGFAVRDRIS
jgi:hypothetical protein